MKNIPFPNPQDADALNDFLDARAAGKHVNPESEVESTAQEFHDLASRAEVNIPQHSSESVKGRESMQAATISAPVSNRTRRQLSSPPSNAKSNKWLSAAIIAGLLISMVGAAWLNREPGNPHNQIAFAPGTTEALLNCPVTLPNNVDAQGGLDHYAADGHTWYENGIWITIPTDGVLTIGPMQQNTNPDSETFGWGFEKLHVLRGEDVDGMVEISGERLDQKSDLAPYNDKTVDANYGSTGFVPIALMIPGEGCWEITATAGDSSATWVVDVRFEDVPWTQPVSFNECPDDAELNAYDPDNPGGTMYSQEDYDQVSTERSYEIVGPAQPEDADAIVTMMRETQACDYMGKSWLTWTARFEYENRTTAGRESINAIADERSEGADGVSSWIETERSMTPQDFYVYQDPNELTLEANESLQTVGLYNPATAVEFSDGRVGILRSVVSYESLPDELDIDSIQGFEMTMSIFVYQDGEWTLDENLPVCIGDCSNLPAGTPIPGVDPMATPEPWAKIREVRIRCQDIHYQLKLASHAHSWIKGSELMQSFHNDDSSYLKWMEENENAFVLNVKSAPSDSAVLHTSRCMHVHYEGDKYVRTTDKKLCAESRDELLDWAKKSALDVSECSTCKSYSVN